MSAFAPPRAGSTRHLVWLYQDASRRDAMTTLFAIEREIAASARPELDHAVTHARLDWWQMESQRLAAGLPSHPLGVSLLAALRATSAPAPDFEPLVDTMRWAAACTAFEDRTELSQCFDAWSRTVFRTAVHLCAVQPHHASLEVLREAGSALREVEALCRLRADASLGRVHLPLAELEALQLDHLAVTRSPWDEPLAAKIGERLRHCAHTLRAVAVKLQPTDAAALRAIMVWVGLGRRRAERAAADLPFQYAARRTDGIADAWCAWRAARAVAM